MLIYVTAGPNWKPDPMPGSPEARVQGCSCPETKRQGGDYVFDSDCPVHELEKVTKQ